MVAGRADCPESRSSSAFLGTLNNAYATTTPQHSQSTSVSQPRPCESLSAVGSVVVRVARITIGVIERRERPYQFLIIACFARDVHGPNLVETTARGDVYRPQVVPIADDALRLPVNLPR